MKIYEKYEQFEFPDDMKRIMNYLKDNGTVFVSARTIEEFYRKFSEEEYFAQWMDANDDNIKLFADWLSELIY